MTPAAHIATMATLAVIFLALIVGSLIEGDQNRKTPEWKRWLRIRRIK